MNCNPILERDDWFITNRKPTICPRCKTKEVRKALGKPLEEDYFRDDIFVIGCIPDFPINRTWGCRRCCIFLKTLQEIGSSWWFNSTSMA